MPLVVCCWPERWLRELVVRRRCRGRSSSGTNSKAMPACWSLRSRISLAPSLNKTPAPFFGCVTIERKEQNDRRRHMNTKKIRPSDKAAQKPAAEELKRQIDEIVSGKAASEPPRTLRDFVKERMTKVRPGKSSRASTRGSAGKKK